MQPDATRLQLPDPRRVGLLILTSALAATGCIFSDAVEANRRIEIEGFDRSDAEVPLPDMGMPDAVVDAGLPDAANQPDARSALPDAGRLPDASPPDASSPDAIVEGDPSFTPCPHDWKERQADAGVSVCDPWPSSSPVDWTCPANWDRTSDNDVTECAPPANWNPMQRACPPGWTQTTTVGATVCEPYAGGAPDVCAQFSAHFPGEPGCSPIGAACPSGDYSDHLSRNPPPPQIVYVKPGFVGGNGATRQSPLGSLDDVQLAALPAGTIIALAKGEYIGDWELSTNVELIGACPEETVLRSSSPFDAAEAIITVRAGHTILRDLRFAESPRGGVSVLRPGAATIDGVIIDGMSGYGVGVSAAELTISDTVIRNTEAEAQFAGIGLTVDTTEALVVSRVIFEANEGLGAFAAKSQIINSGGSLTIENSVFRDSTGSFVGSGRGLELSTLARVRVRRSVFSRNSLSAILVDGPGARLEVDDSVIRETESWGLSSFWGHGVEVRNAGRVEVRGSTIEGNRFAGVWALSGASMTIEDSVIRFTSESDNTGADGYGIVAPAARSVTLNRVVIDGNRAAGISLAGPGLTAAITQTTIRNTRSQESDGTGGFGLFVSNGVEAIAEAVLVENSRTNGVSIAGASTLAQLTHLVVRDTLSQEAQGTFGAGLVMGFGAQVEVRGAAIERSRDSGVVIASGTSGSPTRLTLQDAVIRDTGARAADDENGIGLSVDGAAEATLRRTVIDRNRVSGILVTQGAQLVADDCVVRETRSQVRTGANGWGIAVGSGSSAVLSRLLIADSRDFALVGYLNSQIEAVDLVVHSTGEPTCATGGTCSFTASGVGSITGSSVSLRRAQLIDGSNCGFVLGPESQVSLNDALISGHPVGACLQNPSVGSTDVTGATVLYFDNDIDVANTSLPLP